VQRLDGSTVGDVNEINLILLQDGVRAYEDDAGRQKGFSRAGNHSRVIFYSNTGIGNIVDYLKVLLVHTVFLRQGTFQDENSQIPKDADAPLTFLVFLNSFNSPSFDYWVTRTIELPAIFTTSSVFKLASILDPTPVTTTAPLLPSPTINTAKFH
jgi:hypothetical protein